MSIDTKDFELGGFFTTDGADIWKMVSYCMEPTCTLKNVGNPSESQTFGMDGVTARSFHKIPMPETGSENSEKRKGEKGGQ